MIKTIFFFLIFWLGLLLSLLLLLIYYVLKFAGLKEAEKKFVYVITSNWAKFTLFTAGIKLMVKGRDHATAVLPGFVVISNHQGNFDVPVFLACLPFSAGFIAKKELMKMPFLSSWMNALDCLFIDRNNPRKAREKLIQRIVQKEKNPVFLFPEGTRSRGNLPGPFRTGTLKLLFQNRIEILPVTINGSYKCYEKYGNVKGSTIGVIFHPVLKTSQYGLSEFERFNSDLQKIIAEPLHQNS